MAVHDWTRVAAGIFHAFHLNWIAEISGALNQGILPASYYSLPEQVAGGLEPDVLALCRSDDNGSLQSVGWTDGGIALADAPPKVRIRMKLAENRYAAKANAVAIRHVNNHRVVAMVEIVSPGNKNSQNGLNAFVRKAREMLAADVHLLVVDLFLPSSRDPRGIHGAIWGEDCDEDYVVPQDQPLTCVSYIGGAGAEAFIEPFAVGQPLPEMPLFLTTELYVYVPLAATYQSAFDRIPAYWRDKLATRPETQDAS